MSRRLLMVFCVLASLTWVGGCSEPMPEFGEVSGTVTSKGKPLPNVEVTFLPDPLKKNESPINGWASTDDQGKYTVKYKFKGHEGAGAPIGWHRVTLLDTRFSSIPQGGTLPPRWFSIDYSSPSKTPLTFEVKAEPQTFDIALP